MDIQTAAHDPAWIPTLENPSICAATGTDTTPTDAPSKLLENGIKTLAQSEAQADLSGTCGGTYGTGPGNCSESETEGASSSTRGRHQGMLAFVKVSKLDVF